MLGKFYFRSKLKLIKFFNLLTSLTIYAAPSLPILFLLKNLKNEYQILNYLLNSNLYLKFKFKLVKDYIFVTLSPNCAAPSIPILLKLINLNINYHF
jgi:hypothetical protein